MCDWVYAYRIDRLHPPATLPQCRQERMEIMHELVDRYRWNIWDSADACGVAPRYVRELVAA